MSNLELGDRLRRMDAWDKQQDERLDALELAQADALERAQATPDALDTDPELIRRDRDSWRQLADSTRLRAERAERERDEARQMYEASHSNFMAMAQERDEAKQEGINAALAGFRFKAERDAALADAARLREVLTKYGVHNQGCPAFDYRADERCACGLEEALDGGDA